MKYLSVCSGIEAATCAWHGLGWEPWAFSEIEPFPSAVLKHHYPDVPNFGDMTKFKDWPDGSIDLLVGGTPCQSFSVAGLRKGLADARGNLMLTYLAIAARYSPEWLVWENVPGVLSSNGGRDFASLLRGLAELGYGFAYRVLDAQYFGVPQRRRRVFVVGHLGDWRRAAAVLFERHSLSGHPPPRREAGKIVAPRASVGTFECGGIGSYSSSSSGPLMRTGADLGPGCEALITHSLRAEGFDASEDGTGRGTPLVPIAFDCKASGQNGFGVGEIASTMRSMGHSGSHQNGGGHQAIAIQGTMIGRGDTAGPAGCGYSTDGTSFTLTKTDQHAVAFTQNQRDEVRTMEVAGALAGEPVMKQQTYVAFDLRGREGGAMPEMNDTAAMRAASGGSSRSYVAAPMMVRRLTPRECERLQGFSDDYTLIQVRNKPAADGPRYKALGNSMAVPCMRWIGERIQSAAQPF